jgi:hypothetical protein
MFLAFLKLDKAIFCRDSLFLYKIIGGYIMLCQFTVKNFKSIREELTLDMQATAITEHMDTVITDKDGEKFLPLAVIYGPKNNRYYIFYEGEQTEPRYFQAIKDI